MRFGFMTSVTPNWSLEEVVEIASRFGYQAIEPRVEWGHAAEVGLDSTPQQRKDARNLLEAAGIRFASLALGTRLARATATERQESVDQIARYAELAADLGAPVLRVFGGPLPDGADMTAGRQWAAGTLGQAAERAAEWGVTPCLETHDDFRNPGDVVQVVEAAAHPNVGVVWHPNHHLRLGIPLAEGYQLLAPWIRHVHINEEPLANDPADANRPLRFGDGSAGLEATVHLLKHDNYKGAVCWEWLNGRKSGYVDPTPFLEQNAGSLARFVASA